MTAAPALAVAAALAQRPRHGGHAWAILQYLLGFRRLGYEVLVIDRLDPARASSQGSTAAVESSPQGSFLLNLMARFGFEGRYALLTDDGRSVLGLERAEVMRLARRCEVLINVMGYMNDEELLAVFPLRVFLDIDPGFTQMWKELGLHDFRTGHNRFATIAENIGNPACDIPTCGLHWTTTRPPVVLSEWPAQRASAARLTSVVTWRGPYAPVTFGGATYGLRVHEFRRFRSLPQLTRGDFELVLDIDPADDGDRIALLDNGWTLRDPAVTATPESYRSYVQSSRAELMVAKNMYVKSNSGWFSDRSVCYLASGRPVAAQDTGWTANYPVRDGLLAFRTTEEAACAVQDLDEHYEAHRRGAREVAEELFDSDQVLADLLVAVGAR